MSNAEASRTVERYNALRPLVFSWLSRFDLRHDRDNDGDEGLCLNLEMLPTAPTDARRLVLMFTGVRGVRFTPAEGMLPIRLYLEIHAISDRHWENISYQVFNAEQDVELSFYAEGFQFRLDAGVAP